MANQTDTCYGPECVNTVRSHGLCNSHIRQLRVNGELRPLEYRAKGVHVCDFEDCKRRGFIRYKRESVLCLTHRRQEDAGKVLTSLICTVESCKQDSKSGGMCMRHYNNFMNHGTPIAPPRKKAVVKPRRKTRIEVFNSKWEEDENGCHIWKGFVSTKGQCIFSEGSYQLSPQRWVYKHNLPEGVEMPEMVRNCKVNPLCVNVEHLGASTRAEVAAEWSRTREYNRKID